MQRITETMEPATLGMVEAYKKYYDAGFACLPTSDEKTPAIPKGSSWKGGWNNLKEYKSSHGIGIICGESSVECLDFDNHFGDAEKIFNNFMTDPDVSQIYENNRFAIQSTVSKGFHLIYRCSQVDGSEKLASRINDKGRPDAIIESKGTNGYFCCYPTPGYKFVLNDIFDLPTISVEDRDILFSVAKSFNEVVTLHKDPPSNDGGERASDLYNNTPEALTEMTDALEGAGWVEVIEGKWRRPGKDRGISATLGLAGPGLFFNFSANGHPFKMNGTYSPFQVVSLLKHNGDNKEFAKELYERYKPSDIKAVTGGSTDDQVYSDLEKKLRVDLTADVLPAPAILYLRNNDKLIPSFTLQNFSLITGKAKSRKTFLTVLIVASYLGYLNDIIQADSERKGTVLIIDTEQSPYHLHKMMKRICRLIGEENPERLQAYGLKTLTPEEKRKFIEYKIRTTPDIIMMVIDGIRDLVYDINSPEEATKTSVLLMKWCASNNIHILNVLHQNKSDGNARGHLGSELTNKAETVLSVNMDGTISTVESEYSRELNPSTFSFIINEEELPEICNTPEEDKTVKRSEPHFISNEQHYRILEKVFKDHIERKYKDILINIKLEFGEAGIYFGDNRARDYLAYYIKEGWVSKDEAKKSYKYERSIF